MSKNAGNIFSGCADVTLYDSTNGWWHVGYLGEVNLSGAPLKIPVGHGMQIPLHHSYDFSAAALQSDDAVIAELKDRRNILQTIYIVGAGKKLTLTDYKIAYEPGLPFKEGEPHSIVITAKSPAEYTQNINLLGSYGSFEVDTNVDGIADGWTHDGGAPTGSLESAFSGADGSYSQQAEFGQGETIYSDITCPFDSPMKVSVSAMINAVDAGNMYIKLRTYSDADALLSTYSSAVKSVDGISTETFSAIIKESSAVKTIRVSFEQPDAVTLTWQLDSVIVNIDNLRDYTDD